MNVVKIDGAYVRELTHSGRDDAMNRHMVSLCRELNLATVAEMVETREVAGALRRPWVDYAQGWPFGLRRACRGRISCCRRKASIRRRGSVYQWGGARPARRDFTNS